METKLPTVEISMNECKGCALCIESCPQKVLSLSAPFNRLGYQFAVYAGQGCTGCDACYYACPEPGAITIIKTRKAKVAG